MRRHAAVGLALLALGCPPARDPSGDRVARLRAEQRALQARLQAAVAGDPVVAAVEAEKGNVVIGLGARLVTDLVGAVSARYLGRVRLELPLDQRVQESGEVRTKTLLGEVTAGRWRVDLRVEHVQAVLAAGAPAITLQDGAVHLRLPVAVLDAEGRATVHFSWDSRRLVSLVCRDFAVTETLVGTVRAAPYVLPATFTVGTAGGHLVATPRVDAPPLEVTVDLTDASWQAIQRALAAQDKLHRCGLGLDPQELLPRLRAIGARGFSIRLPTSLLGSVRLPANIRSSVAVEDRTVDLAVAPAGLRLTPAGVWYAAAVEPRVRLAAAPQLSQGSPGRPKWP